MASLDNKGIIRLEDICELTEEGEDILCAVVPRYNCSLEEAIQGGALTSNRARLSIAISLLDAVAVLHSNGVVHRDIKSANVMLSEELRPVLIDFSLAKYMPVGAAFTEKAPSDSAEHTGSVGTPTYMAPELVEANGENLRYDSRVDSWSVGVVLLELLTGKVMEECKDRAAFRMIDEAKARMSDKPVPRIVKGLLEVEPDKRLKCSDAYKKLLQCSSHADKENSNEGFLLSDSSKPLSDYFGNYVVAGGAHAGELQEIRRFYHVLEMTNPTTIKAAMYYSSLFDQSTEDKPPPLHLLLLAQKIYEPRTIDLVTIDEFDEDDPQLSDFDIDEYMKDEMIIMKA
ncbi:P-TEFb-associated cyclin-dependent protein kinase Cdk9, partial [Perkinsus olseni]